MDQETYSLLWSKKSNSFHLEPLQETIKAGMRFFNRDGTSDYLLIGVGTSDAMSARAESLRQILSERGEVRSLFGDGE